MENSTDSINWEILFPEESSPQQNPDPLPVANPQTKSPFFRLPREIRDEIYSYLFCPMELIFSDTAIGYYEPIVSATHYHGDTHTPTNALAILRTCHRAHSEIGYF